MKLQNLLKDVEVLRIVSEGDLEIVGLANTSKSVCANYLFFCIDGKSNCGDDYLSEAIKNGASVVVSEKIKDVSVAQIIVKDARVAMAVIAANFFDNPQQKLKIVHTIGTNGKTSTTKILRHIFETNGKKVGIFCTGAIEYAGKRLMQSMTTPDPIDMYYHMSKMVENGIEYLFMEMSAQAIYYKKYIPMHAKVGIFTNCYSEHMEFFKDYDEYARTKQSYFCKQNCEIALVNNDDSLSFDIARSIDCPLFSYSIENPADCFAIDIIEGEFVANIFDSIMQIKHNLKGKFNVYNLLAAATTAFILGLKSYEIVSGIESLREIKGRFNLITIGGRKFIIDYAHTENAMLNVLVEARKLATSRLIVLFGCGGERDQTKRPKMGKLASELADFVIITSDNPRFEDANMIMNDIEKGIEKDNYIKIESRSKAINFAKNYAQEGDVVLICGKGDEEYQEICGIKTAFSDYNYLIE